MFGMRVFAKLADIFCQKHIVVSEHLIEELKPLKLKKPIEVRANPVFYSKPVKKKPHKGFNILFYCAKGSNKRFKEWVYGKDLVERLKDYGYNIIEVNGNHDMNEVYPIIDFYVRPNRHDGCPRMIRECEINNIPYYYTHKDPSFDDMLQAIIKTENLTNAF